MGKPQAEMRSINEICKAGMEKIMWDVMMVITVEVLAEVCS